LKNRSRWVTPAVGFVLAIMIGAIEYHRTGSAPEAAVAFAIVAGYAAMVLVLQTRSETASLLAGLPVDERWYTINDRSLARAARVMAVFLSVSFVGVELTGGDAKPYAWSALVLVVAYLASTLWYRSRM
jgi:hypothetical protein